MRWGSILAAAAAASAVGCDQSFLHGVPRAKAPTPRSSGGCVVDAAPTDLMVVLTGPTTASVSWTNRATNAEGVRVFRQQVAPNVGVPTEAGVVDIPIDTLSDADLVLDAEYEFYAVAEATACFDSPESAAVTVQTPPVAPTSVGSLIQSPTEISLTWLDLNGLPTTDYRIERSLRGAGNFTFNVVVPRTMTNNYSDTMVSAGTAYDYRVSAINAAGESVPSSVATVWTQFAPVQNLIVSSVSANQIDISWTDPNTDSTGYDVSFKESANPTFVIAMTTVTSYSAAALTTGTDHDFEVEVTGPPGSLSSAPVALNAVSTSAPPVVAFDMAPPVLDSACNATFAGTVTFDSAHGAVFDSASGTISVVSGMVSADAMGVLGQIDDFMLPMVNVDWTVTDDLGGTSTALHTYTMTQVPDTAPPLSALVLPSLTLGDNGMASRQVIFTSVEAPSGSSCGSCAGPRGSISSTGEHTCVVIDTGEVRCWGDNLANQQGNGFDSSSMMPDFFTRATPMCETGNWDGAAGTPCSSGSALSGVVAVSASTDQTCMLMSDGEAKCVGDNGMGGLGNGIVGGPNRPIPTPVCESGDVLSVCSRLGGLVALTSGGDFGCGLTSAGTVRCWGDNSEGYLGDGTNTARPNPSEVCDTGAFATVPQRCEDASAASALTNVLAVEAGLSHACALLGTGRVKCWGSNSSSQLGEGDDGTPPMNELLPVDVCTAGSVEGADCTLLQNVLSISATQGRACAIRSGGEVWCWGDNGGGALGAGLDPMSTLESAVAVPMCLTGAWNGSVCAGGMIFTDAIAVDAGEDHTCVLKSDSQVWCAGADNDGALGAGASVSDQWNPVQMCEAGAWNPGMGVCHDGVLPRPFAGAVAVAAGRSHTCMLMQDGTAMCTGIGSRGQLGDGMGVTLFLPVAICDGYPGSCAAQLINAAVRTCNVTTISY